MKWMKNIIEEKDRIIYELKEENNNKENIIQSLNDEKNQALKNIFNLKENEHEQYRSQIIQRFSRCGI